MASLGVNPMPDPYVQEMQWPVGVNRAHQTVPSYTPPAAQVGARQNPPVLNTPLATPNQNQSLFNPPLVDNTRPSMTMAWQNVMSLTDEEWKVRKQAYAQKFMSEHHIQPQIPENPLNTLPIASTSNLVPSTQIQTLPSTPYIPSIPNFIPPISSNFSLPHLPNPLVPQKT